MTLKCFPGKLLAALPIHDLTPLRGKTFAQAALACVRVNHTDSLQMQRLALNKDSRPIHTHARMSAPWSLTPLSKQRRSTDHPYKAWFTDANMRDDPDIKDLTFQGRKLTCTQVLIMREGVEEPNLKFKQSSTQDWFPNWIPKPKPSQLHEIHLGAFENRFKQSP